MSSLKLCDADDCYQTENDCYVYHINRETADFLKEHCSHWFKSSFDNICQDCIEQTNIDYPNFFIVDNYNDLIISEKYLDNPLLLK